MATGTATLSFGATPTDVAEVDVTGQAAIGSGSSVEAFWMRRSTASNDGDSHEIAALLIALVVGDIVAGTGFTIFARANDAGVTGDFTVDWAWV